MNSYKVPALHDPLNLLNLRNMRNTSKRYYNCGGYAFGTFSWYWPGRTEEEHEKIMKYAKAEDWANALALAAEAITNELPGWYRVPMAKVMGGYYSPNEYEVVAMRFCNFDYHFWKLGRNWNWYDKLGSSSHIHRHAFDAVKESTWHYWYDSPVVCFVRAR